MRQPDDRTPHFHTRRQVLLGITALAALSACGGRSAAASVTDRQVAAAPGVSLHVRDWPSAKGSGKPLPNGR